MLDMELDLDPRNWEWKGCLSFPVSQLTYLGFSSKPYRWIQYATGAVLGAHGKLCIEQDLPNPTPINYDAPLSETSIDLYYHTINEEKQQMFLIDPFISNIKTVPSSSSQRSLRWGGFCMDMQNQDGSCVVSGAISEICQATHLVSHSKGDKV